MDIFLLHLQQKAVQAETLDRATKLLLRSYMYDCCLFCIRNKR